MVTNQPTTEKTTTPASGSALLLVVGATAALSVLALGLLTSSLVAYEITGLQRDGAQARLLAESALDLLGPAVAVGRVALPPPAGTTVWEGRPPAPPPEVAAASGSFASVASSCGYRVRITLVPGPLGPQRLHAEDIEAILFDAVAEGWCRRGYHQRAARFARRDDGGVLRLY